jgi:hypothetical protein
METKIDTKREIEGVGVRKSMQTKMGKRGRIDT